MSDDARNRAARYRMDPEAAPDREQGDDQTPRRPPRPEDQALWIDLQIRAAIERGEFDNLPYAGKPLPHIDSASDPNWWLKQFIERENITGVLPEALRLRKDDASLHDDLDPLRSESAVREAVEEFNRRVLVARRQLQGGPPVVTPLRDIEIEVVQWRVRRSARSHRSPGVEQGTAASQERRRPIRRAWDRLRRSG